MTLVQADRHQLLPLLEELTRAVEELLQTGLTTASESTRQTLHVSFQEASRLRLLRLGFTLRGAEEELGRFTRNEPEFSRWRLTFFLNRAWLLSHGLARALRDRNEPEFERLAWIPAHEPIEQLHVVTLGVTKKVTSTFVAFGFRLRTVQPCGNLPVGCRLVWSCVFPVKPGLPILAECFLHLPQKQKFSAHLFLEGKTVIIEKAAVALDETGSGRLSFGDQCKVTTSKPFADWELFLTWDPAAVRERLRSKHPGPLDLEIELQEEVVLRDWHLGEPGDPDTEGRLVYPLVCGPLVFDALVSPGSEGKALKHALDGLRKKRNRPPLFGLMHYEKCRLVLQPLSIFAHGGLEYLTLSKERIDRTTLLRALKF